MSQGEQDYPNVLPIEGVQEIIRIVRAGNLVTERSAFAKHAWNVQGYLQKVVLGEPAVLIGSASPASDADALAALECLKSRAYAAAEGVTSPTLPLPVQTILTWLVNKLLESLFTRAI
ncbi:hypothetical protein K2Y11_00485 [bacterium]|nr:hypothetical protein [bacterium]